MTTFTFDLAACSGSLLLLLEVEGSTSETVGLCLTSVHETIIITSSSLILHVYFNNCLTSQSQYEPQCECLNLQLLTWPLGGDVVQRMTTYLWV